VELGYSAMTRRERLERIAMAERDRRAGRVEVAIAALGEATEWPARAVLALAKLPEFEAAETRQILEEGLDVWLAEVGLESFEETVDQDVVDEDGVEAPVERGAPELDPQLDLQLDPDLVRPIDNDELDRAFADAEAQTDEMHSANHVAARVLMDEPIGLAELQGDALAPVEDSTASLAMDAAMVADLVVGDRFPSPPEALATLERWLQNLEGRGARRAR
jgi:hypothetical protein